ncbi:hypothetical protein RV13_GL000809 [Enterococcus raffinosus]|nr:hypothetical protein RV13_GL000809 [Enterococcus raffinosus]
MSSDKKICRALTLFFMDAGALGINLMGNHYFGILKRFSYLYRKKYYPN